MSYAIGGLSSSDYTNLSRQLSLQAEVIARRFQSGRWSDFKVSDLKHILNYLRSHNAWKDNPLIKNCNNKSKESIILALRNAAVQQNTNNNNNNTQNNNFSYNQQQPPQQPNGSTNPSNYYPYGYNPTGNLVLNNPIQAIPNTGGGMPPYINNNNSNNNTYNYTTGSQVNNNYPFNNNGVATNQAARNQYSHTYQNPNNANNNNPNLANKYSNLVANATNNQPIQSIQTEIQRIRSAAGFLEGRSPYDHIQSTPSQGLLYPANNTSSSCRTTLNFQVQLPYLQRLRKTTANLKAIPPNQQLIVHLRLFDSVSLQHHNWDRSFRVRVNGYEITIPEPRKLSKTKKKGLEIIRPLIITDQIQANNFIDIEVFRNSYMSDLFKGLVVVEIVRERDTSELMEILTKKHELELERQKLLLNPDSATEVKRKTCAVCGVPDNLQRCSRCKNEWYCGELHQRQHWAQHRVVCVPPTKEQELIREQERIQQEKLSQIPKPNQTNNNNNNNTTNGIAPIIQKSANGKTKLTLPHKVKRDHNNANGGTEDDDELVEVDTMVSLKDPLLLERIKLAAKGRKCSHLPCFDVETFLMFNGQSGIWQCFDDRHQLLTIDGFKFVNELNLSTQIATYNPNTKQIEYHLPNDIIMKQGIHEMVHVYQHNELTKWTNNDQHNIQESVSSSDSPGIYLCTTKDHDWYTRFGYISPGTDTIKYKSQDYTTVSAHQLFSNDNNCVVQLLAAAQNGIKIDKTNAQHLFEARKRLHLNDTSQLNAFIELYGYWLGSGSFDYSGNGNHHCLSLFVNSKSDYQSQYLSLLFTRLQFTHTDLIFTDNQDYAIINKGWIDLFDSEYGYNNKLSNKRLMNWVYELEKDQLRLLIHGLQMASGSKNQSHIYTSDVTFRDQIIQLCFHAGYNATFQISCTNGSTNSWRINYSDNITVTEPVIVPANNIQQEVACGKVYCVNVPNHLVFARCVKRDNNNKDFITYASKTIIIGNCPICYYPLPFDEIVINDEMNAILEETNEEVAQIRVNEVGDYEPVGNVEENDNEEPAKKKMKTEPGLVNTNTNTASSSGTSKPNKSPPPIAIELIDDEKSDSIQLPSFFDNNSTNTNITSNSHANPINVNTINRNNSRQTTPLPITSTSTNTINSTVNNYNSTPLPDASTSTINSSDNNNLGLFGSVWDPNVDTISTNTNNYNSSTNSSNVNAQAMPQYYNDQPNNATIQAFNNINNLNRSRIRPSSTMAKSTSSNSNNINNNTNNNINESTLTGGSSIDDAIVIDDD